MYSVICNFLEACESNLMVFGDKQSIILDFLFFMEVAYVRSLCLASCLLVMVDG